MPYGVLEIYYIRNIGAEHAEGAGKGIFRAFGGLLEGRFLCIVTTTFLFREFNGRKDSN